MRGLAELAMRGPKHAMIIATIFASIPMFFWLGAAIISLVVLHQGTRAGLKMLLWAALPGIAWSAMGQLSILIGLTTTVTLALVLRQTASWQKTLAMLLPAGTVISLVLWQLTPQQIAMISELVTTFIHEYIQQSGQNPDELLTHLQPLVQYLVLSVVTWFNLLFCILALMLARFWQAQLYNPGGFRKEFHQIRLPWRMVILLFVLFILSLNASLRFLLILIPAATLPLLIAGLALIHGLVGMKQLGSFWLIGSYILLALVTQLAYPVIVFTACLDSLFDFRGRATNRLHQG